MEFLRLLESIRSPFLDTVVGLITRLGEETVAIAILCAIFWCISKRAAYGIGVAYFLSGLTVQGIKICVRVDRPWIIDPTLSPVPSAIENATGYSFPSGHTQSAAAFFGSLGVQIKRKSIKAVCFLLAILVAFSRLYLGVHTPLDVITSLLISSLFILLTFAFFISDSVSKNREIATAVFMLVFACVVIGIAVSLYSRNIIEQAYAADCLKAAGAGFGFAAGMYIERNYIDFSVKTKSFLWQIMKYILGLAGVLALKEGLKIIIGTSLVADTVRYFIVIAWVTLFFPLIIRRFLQENKKDSTAAEA